MALYSLEVEPLDLGADVRAVGMELLDTETREPVRGAEAARVWGRVLPALAAGEPWALDFFSHLDRVRDYCDRRGIAYRQAAPRSVVIAALEAAPLVALLERFQDEMFGARAGRRLDEGDSPLEQDLSGRGIDAYHHTYGNYLFCAVCDLGNGFLTLLADKLWAQEVMRRIRPALAGLDIEVYIPN